MIMKWACTSIENNDQLTLLLIMSMSPHINVHIQFTISVIYANSGHIFFYSRTFRLKIYFQPLEAFTLQKLLLQNTSLSLFRLLIYFSGITTYFFLSFKEVRSPDRPGTLSLFDISLKETLPKCIVTKDGS